MDRDLKDKAKAMVHIEITTTGVVGEVALLIEPGTLADTQRQSLDGILAERLTELALQLNLVLTARPSSFAFGLPGKDAEGRTRFSVRGRREGDRLVPWSSEVDPSDVRRRGRK